MSTDAQHHRRRMHRLWSRLMDSFGRGLVTSEIGASPNPAWVHALAPLTDEQLARGVVAMQACGRDLPPSLPRFREWCLDIDRDEILAATLVWIRDGCPAATATRVSQSLVAACGGAWTVSRCASPTLERRLLTALQRIGSDGIAELRALPPMMQPATAPPPAEARGMPAHVREVWAELRSGVRHVAADGSAPPPGDPGGYLAGEAWWRRYLAARQEGGGV